MDIDMEICQATMGQQDNDRWWTERGHRITASKFGRIMSARGDDSLRRLHRDMTAPPSTYVPAACRMGIAEEGNAKRTYIKYKMEVEGVTVSVAPVGLCVPNWSTKIASSPDGIVVTAGNHHVLEIKCIYDKNTYPKSIADIARERGSRFYCTVDEDGALELRKNHQYYYQVLGEMATTGLHQAAVNSHHESYITHGRMRLGFSRFHSIGRSGGES